MASYLASIPPLTDFLPPTPQAYGLLVTVFKTIVPFSLLLWSPQVARLEAMGRTSSNSRFNLPGRYGWAMAESVGPLNMVYIISTLGPRLLRRPAPPHSLLGTGMPFFYHELLALLYLLHYLNRAIITPLFRAPSMSPISPLVVSMMAIFQFLNSSCIACWLVYDASSKAGPTTGTAGPLSSLLSPLSTNPLPIFALFLFILGLYGNVSSERTLFSLRRSAALRRAKSEGKPLHNVSYHKVYVIPDARGWFKHILFPHYALEWVQWTGYWLMGGLAGLGWSTPALWFVLNELATMAPRAVDGVRWYDQRFGRRAVAGRKAVIPGLL